MQIFLFCNSDIVPFFVIVNKLLFVWLTDGARLGLFVLVFVHVNFNLTGQILAHFATVFKTLRVNTRAIKDVHILLGVSELRCVQANEADAVDEYSWAYRAHLVIVYAENLLSMLDSDVLTAIIFQECIGFTSSKAFENVYKTQIILFYLAGIAEAGCGGQAQ